MSLTAGTRLGAYEIRSALGAGGMGEVYRARDTTLNRDVALTILPDAFASDPDRLARFTREAPTLAALNHPHTAHIYGLERQEAREGQNPTTGNEVWLVGLSPVGVPRPMVRTSANEAYPAFSADGHLIAYTSTETGSSEVYVQAFPGGEARVQISRGGGTNPSWTRDGAPILYLTPDSTKMMMVDVERGDSAHVGQTRVFAEGSFASTTPVGGFDMARDGSLLVALDTNRPASQSLEQLQLVVNATSIWPRQR